MLFKVFDAVTLALFALKVLNPTDTASWFMVIFPSLAVRAFAFWRIMKITNAMRAEREGRQG